MATNDSLREQPMKLAMVTRQDSGAGPDAASAQVAAAAVARWHAIDGALNGIIGARGVAALYRRSLSQAGLAQPWLAAVPDAAAAADPYEALGLALAGRSVAQAGAAADLMLSGFRDLLASLIGSALADRLLIEVEPLPPSGAAAQESER